MAVTLLIADGEAASREELARFLSGAGFRPETACDGLECLGKGRSHEPEVLVVDRELPWGGAAAVAAFLSETHFEFKIPAIVVIGHAPPAVLSRWTGVPRSSCFQKPVRMESLLDRVGLLIARIEQRATIQNLCPIVNDSVAPPKPKISSREQPGDITDAIHKQHAT